MLHTSTGWIFERPVPRAPILFPPCTNHSMEDRRERLSVWDFWLWVWLHGLKRRCGLVKLRVAWGSGPTGHWGEPHRGGLSAVRCGVVSASCWNLNIVLFLFIATVTTFTSFYSHKSYKQFPQWRHVGYWLLRCFFLHYKTVVLKHYGHSPLWTSTCRRRPNKNPDKLHLKCIGRTPNHIL